MSISNDLWIPLLSPKDQKKLNKCRKSHYTFRWTGFPGKTLWDWLQLLIVPMVIAAGTLWFTAQQGEVSSQASDKQHQTDLQIAQDQQREAALKTYLDDMSDLLLNHNLRESKQGEEVGLLARERTLTILRRLDADRNGLVLQFLQDSHLIGGENAVISLAGSDLRNDDLAGANFSGADLSGANLSNAHLSSADLSNTSLSEANLSGADLSSVNLSNASLSEANFSGANLSDANLSDADLGANSNVHLIGADLSNAHLRDANLSNAHLGGADLKVSGMDLSKVNFKYTIAFGVGDTDFDVFFKGADLSSADFVGARFWKSNLSGANLGGADLRGTVLRGANLSTNRIFYTNLGYADLRYADLRYADLSGTDLSDANLSGADIGCADLRNTVISQGQLGRVRYLHDDATMFGESEYTCRSR